MDPILWKGGSQKPKQSLFLEYITIISGSVLDELEGRIHHAFFDFDHLLNLFWGHGPRGPKQSPEEGVSVLLRPPMFVEGGSQKPK